MQALEGAHTCNLVGMHHVRRLRYELWMLHEQAKEALERLDQAGLMFRPDAEVLCLRGECCSALGNNAMVRRPSPPPAC